MTIWRRNQPYEAKKNQHTVATITAIPAVMVKEHAYGYHCKGGLTLKVETLSPYVTIELINLLMTASDFGPKVEFRVLKFQVSLFFL